MGKPTVWEMVREAIDALGGSTTNAAVRAWVQDKYPGTNRSTINCQMIAGTVNHPSRVHYSIDARPRLADRPVDVYFRPAKGQIELYQPAKHGLWEIFEASPGRLSVRPHDGVKPPPPLPPVEVADTDADAGPVVPDAGAEPKQKGEKAWVETLQPRLEAALQSLSFNGVRVRVDTGYRLPYAYEVLGYQEDDPDTAKVARYETDLLVYDELPGGRWVPRVIVECKIKGVSTHDALTYSAKAATHKHVHPYLRYGMLVGSYGAVLPARLVRHGAYFDFMMVWEEPTANEGEWSDLTDVLVHEVRASRRLQELLASKGGAARPFRLLHRRVEFKG